jgi:hypothetical protein
MHQSGVEKKKNKEARGVLAYSVEVRTRLIPPVVGTRAVLASSITGGPAARGGFHIIDESVRHTIDQRPNSPK